MEIEQIIEAFKTNPALIEGVLPSVVDSEVGKKLIENKAKLLSDETIGIQINKVHDLYDQDVFEILGIRAGTNADGKKEKTYELVKKLLGELKELKETKDSLTKDAKVLELTNQIELLKKDGGGAHVQSVFDQAKSTWEAEKQTYLKQIGDGKTESESFQKRTEIQSGIASIKFNPDTPESIKKMVIDNVERELIANSKLENGKLIFLDKDGKPVIDSTTYQPKTATQMLLSLDAIKDISLKEDKNPGGGADKTIVGSIQTTTVEGKDTQKLILPEGSIKTKTQFIEVAEKALLDSGISKRDPRWNELKDKAYVELKVSEMPAK